MADAAAPLYLTLDCSTTAAKAVVFDGHGVAVAAGSRPLAMSRPRPGWHEQDAEQWWGASVAALRDAVDRLADPAAVVALCVTHQRESFVCLDADDHPLRPAILWVDTRAASQITEFGSAAVARRSGKPPDVTPAIYKLAWLNRHEPDVLRAAVRVGDVQAWLCRRLTGRWATGVGSADALGLFDLAELGWADDLLAIAGLRPDQLPELVPAGELLGPLLPAAAHAIGLPGPVALVAGTGDGQAAGLGAGAVAAGHAYLNLGTSMVMGVTSPRYVVDPAFRTLAGPTAGTYVLETLLNSAGYLIRWFDEQFGGPAGGSGHPAHDVGLDRAAAALPPGSDGLLTVPYWNAVQSPYWDPLARGATVGWHGGHTRAHFYRSLLEGVAYELRLQLDGLDAATGVPVTTISAVGGGTRSATWVQILADVTGRRIDLVAEAEVSARGAAVLARAYATGHGNAGVAAIAGGLAGPVRAVEPDLAAGAAHADVYRRYVTLYPALRAFFAATGPSASVGSA